MIETQEGADLFDLPVEALVNPVNVLEGVMGAGLAKMFAAKWPELLVPYKEACRKKELRIGTVMVVPVTPKSGQDGSQNQNQAGLRYIIHFPTKHSWRQPSELKYIKEAMPAFREALIKHQIKSVAIPGLGCGFGELEWPAVERVIREGLEGLENVSITLIPPRPMQRRGGRR